MTPTMHELILDAAKRARLHVITNAPLRNYIERNGRRGVIGTTDRVFDLQDARETARASVCISHMRILACNTAVDSYSIHGVNLSKAFASAARE